MRSGLSEGERGVERVDAGKMRAIGAGAGDDLGVAVEEERDLAGLHDGGDLLHAVDQRALVGLRQAKQHRGNVARRKRSGKLAREGCRVAERRGDEVEARGRVLRVHRDVLAQ